MTALRSRSEPHASFVRQVVWTEEVSTAVRAAFESQLARARDAEPHAPEDPATRRTTVHVVAGEGRPSIDGHGNVVVPASYAYRVAAASEVFDLATAMFTVATGHRLGQRGAWERVAGAGERGLSIAELADACCGRREPRALGTVYSAMRLLALRGWVVLRGSDATARVAVSPLGAAVAAALSEHADVIERAVRATDHARDYARLLRRSCPLDAGAHAELLALVDAYERGWWRAGSGAGAVELARGLDGFLLCAVLVACVLPACDDEGAAVDLPLVVPDADAALDAERVMRTFHPEFTAAMRRVLSRAEALRPDRGGVDRLTPWGRALLSAGRMAAVPVSYFKTYARLDDYLFGASDPLHIPSDAHVDRTMNIFGAGAGALSFVEHVCDRFLATVFDTTPLEEQPAGVADMGCGDGRALRAVAEYVVHRTERGRHLDRFPLAVIGADVSTVSRERARTTLAGLAEISGVRVGVVAADVADPAAYDAAVQALGLDVRDARGSGPRALRGADLLHVTMFLLHNRRITVRSEEHARALLRDGVERFFHAHRGRFEPSLTALGVDAGALANAGATDDVARLVEGCFETSFCGDEILLPGFVAAADLVGLLREWRPLCGHGFLVVEGHDPAPRHAVPVPTAAAGAVRAARLRYAGFQWAFHSVSRQYQVPYPEHELAMSLAGLFPVNGVTDGGIFDPRVPTLDRLSTHRMVSYALYRAA